jgi:hypothetical protein
VSNWASQGFNGVFDCKVTGIRFREDAQIAMNQKSGDLPTEFESSLFHIRGVTVGMMEKSPTVILHSWRLFVVIIKVKGGVYCENIRNNSSAN